jgi:hypothetical protein
MPQRMAKYDALYMKISYTFYELIKILPGKKIYPNIAFTENGTIEKSATIG